MSFEFWMGNEYFLKIMQSVERPLSPLTNAEIVSLVYAVLSGISKVIFCFIFSVCATT